MMHADGNCACHAGHLSSYLCSYCLVFLTPLCLLLNPHSMLHEFLLFLNPSSFALSVNLITSTVLHLYFIPPHFWIIFTFCKMTPYTDTLEAAIYLDHWSIKVCIVDTTPWLTVALQDPKWTPFAPPSNWAWNLAALLLSHGSSPAHIHIVILTIQFNSAPLYSRICSSNTRYHTILVS